MKLKSPKDKARFDLVKKTAERYAKKFGLRLRKVSPLPRGKSYTGLCYFDGEISISLWYLDQTPAASYYVLDTLAHELAHLAHLNHRREWALLFSRIFARMVKDGRLEKFRAVWKRNK